MILNLSAKFLLRKRLPGSVFLYEPFSLTLFNLMSLDLVGTQAMRHYLGEAYILSSSLPQEVAYDCGRDQEKARYT